MVVSQWLGVLVLTIEGVLFHWLHNRMARNPEGHSPKYWSKHPEALRAREEIVVAPLAEGKDGLTLGDSIAVLALLIGVYFVIVAPPLYAKVPLLVLVCGGFVWFTRTSHWSHSWSSIKKNSWAVILVVLLCVVSFPQFVGQWKSEHPGKSSNTTKPNEVGGSPFDEKTMVKDVNELVKQAIGDLQSRLD